MPDNKKKFSDWEKELYPPKEVKGVGILEMTEQLKQQPEPESQKIEPPPIEQQKSIEPLQKQPSQTDYDILKQRYKDAQTEMSAFEQHRQRLNAPEPTTPQATKEQLEYKGASLGEYGAYIGEKNVQKEKQQEEAKRIEQGIKEQGIEFIKQERLKKQYEEQQKIKTLQQNLNPDIDKKIKEYEDKQPAWTEQFSLIHKLAKNEEEQLHYDIQSQLYNNDRLNYDIARNVLLDTKNILNAPTKTEGGGFFEAASNELKQLDTWVTIAGLADNLQKSSVIKYAQTGKPLTTSESALLDAVFDYYYVSNERAGNISKAYLGGQMAGKSIPFMIDFVLTGGFASGATGGFGKAMAKHIENKLINKFGKEAYKKLTKTGVDRLIKAPGKFGEEVVAGAIQAPMTPTFYTGVIEETMAKPIEKTDKGYVFQQGAPIKDAVIRGMNEVIFERSGEFIGDVFSPLGKALSSVNYFTKIPSTKLKNFNRLFYGGKGTFAETLKATGFNGLSAEMGEEVLGQVANYVTGASTKEELDEFFSKDNFQAMLMGFAPMTGVSVAGNVAQRLTVNNNHKKAVNNINTDFGNQAPDVIAALNETSPDRIQNIVDEIMLNNGGYEGNKITNKGKRMATDMLRYIYTKAQVEAVKGIDQDNYKTIGAPKSAENYLQDGKHTVSLYDEQGEVIVQKQFENEEAAEKYKQKLNEMYMTPNNEFDNKINEGLNNLTQKTVTKLNALKSNQKNANGEDVIVSAIVQGLSSEAIGVPNGTEIYVYADNGKQSLVHYAENGELKKAVIPNENITEKKEELLSDVFIRYMETATKTMYQTAAQTNQVIMEGLAEEENMTTNDFSTKKAGHKIKYDGKEATIQSVDTDNDGNKYADLELEDGSIIKSVPLRNVKNPKTVTFNVGKQRIELSKSNETGYFQSEIYSKEKAETIKNGIQISDDYISEIKEQPNPANPIEKGYRVIIREKTEEEKQSKTEVFDMLKTNIVENGLYVRNKKGFVSIIPADEIEINELTDKGELRFTDKESGIPIIMPLENQQELKAEYEQQQLETQKGTTTEVKPETTTVESKVETEPTYKELFEQTKQQYGVETAIQDIQDEITLKNQQLEEVNNKLKKASLKEKATLREQLQFINRELTELNNILKSEEYAIKERNVAEDNIQKYQSRDEGGETAEASRSDSVEPSTEKQSETEAQPIVETPVSEDKKVVAPTKPQGVEVPTEKKVGEKAVKQYSELTETERELIDVSNKRSGGKLDVDNVILIAEKIAKSENKEIDVQHVAEALNYEMSKNDPTYGRLTTDDVNGDIVDGNINVAMLERMEEVGVLPKEGVAEIKKAKELADRIKKMNLSTNVKSLLKTTIDTFYVFDANQNNNSLGIGVVDNINDLLDRIDKNKDNSYFTDKKGKKTKLTFDQVVSQEIYNKIKEGKPTEDGENPTIKESLQVEDPKLSLSELPKKSYATINFYDGDTRTGEIIKETDKEISIKSDAGRIYTVPNSNIVERYDEKPQPKFAISEQPLSNLSSEAVKYLLEKFDKIGIEVVTDEKEIEKELDRSIGKNLDAELLKFNIENNIDSEFDYNIAEILDEDKLIKLASLFNNESDFIESIHNFRDSHVAPSMDDSSVEKKLEDGGDFSLTEVAQGLHNQPSDYFDPRVGARYYGYDDLEGKQSYTAISNVIRALKAGNKNVKVTTYRAIPKDINVSKLQDYDWVTFSEEYAIGHGEHRFGEGEYKIIKQEVSPDELWWDGNDINEWGYDTGNTKKWGRIELSKIYKKAKKENLQFSIIGEQGAEALDKAEEATTRMDNLRVAREMEQIGIEPYFEAYKKAQKKIDELNEKEDFDLPKRDEYIQDIERMYNVLGYKTYQSNRDIHKAFREAYKQNDITLLPKAKGNLLIKLATGWGRGADSKWKYEIPDVDTTKLEEKIEKNKDKYDEGTGIATYLGEYIDNDSDVFKAFPELKNIDLTISVKESNKNTGSYKDKKPQTEREFGNPPIIKIEVSSINEVKSILIHEIQHAIQEIEGFAKGGNVERVVVDSHLLNKGFKSIDELKAAVSELKIRYKKVYNEWYNKAFGKRYKGQKTETNKLLNEWQELEKQINGLEEATYDKQEAFNVYKRLAGEVEARNASNRMNFTEEERRQTLLSETEDVAREDQIILMDSLLQSNEPRFSIDSGIKVSDIGFYSTVEKALQSIKQDKGTKEQFKVMLLNNGAKQAEMDWMGFDELPEKLTKSDIQEWIDENRIEVEEVEKGAYSNRDLELVKVEPFVYNVVDTKTGKVVLSNVSQSRADDFIDNAHDGTDTKFAQYTLPGGENYKEVLLTMPSKYRYFSKEMYDKYGEDWINNMTESELERKKQLEDTYESYFQSSHFDEPNILAHIRFNERTDSEGNKVLFIEEIQSDWAQKGKKEGFKSGLTYKIEAPTQGMQDNGNFDYTAIISDKNGNEVERRSMFNKLELENWARTKTDTGTTPNMPFKKTDQWLNLALRRMMRYAAENGFDRIAWTNGEQQAERYDLSKQVEYVKSSLADNGEYFIKANDHTGNNIISNYYQESELQTLIGKELAEKIIEDSKTNPELKTYSGLDLKVGGEGMKAFYDGIVPSTMSKLGKPFNAKVETIKMDIGEQQSIPVTEKMKQTALEGLPLFLKTPNGEIYGFAKNGKIYLTKKGINPNTMVHEYTHLWFSALEKANPNLFNRAMSLLPQTKEWDRVKNDPAYKNISNNDKEIASEVLSRLSGKDAERILNETPSIKDKLTKLVNDFWAWFKDTFANWSKEEADKISLEDLINMPLIDIEKETPLMATESRMAASEKSYESQLQEIKDNAIADGTFDVENEDIRFAFSPTEQQRQAINYINEIADSETVEDAEASTNYRKAYIERYEALKAKLTAKNPNIVETYQDVLKYLEALANDKTWSRWDKSARPQLKSIRDSVKELKKAGSIRGLKNKLDKAVDIVLERQNETARRIIKNFVNQKLEGKKGKGVRIPKLVDDTTRQFFDSIKEWINKDSQSIDNELQKLQNEYETKKEGNEKNKLEAQIKAFTDIQYYKSDIKRSEDNISNIIIEINKLSKEYTLKDIRKEISLKYSLIAKNKKRLEKADERTKVDIIEENINLKKEIEDKQKEYKLLKQSIILSKANKEQLETFKTSLLNERISMQNSMETFIKQLDMVLREGIKAKRLFAEKEGIRKHAILQDAYLDLAMSETQSVINPAKKESRLVVWRKLLDPVYTYSYMLKSFAIYSPDGRGRLYERFLTNGVMVARQKELNGIKEATKAIDVKIIKIFGEGNHITQVQNICNKFNGASITIKTKVNKLNAEKGEYEVIEQEHIQEINNGQALYIYAIAKMPDGMIKLNAMGIDQEQIDAVTATLDPKLIEFMDWVQDEYLPVLRAKYNDTHIDLFGTQLDQIDKYFPLNIDRSAIPSEVDIEDKGNFFGLPTTITGSIIKRVFNKHAIDIKNSDAIETLINHVQSMEKWNAYAPVIKDLNTLNSDNTFKKHIDRYIYNGAANQFKDMCAIAVGSYVPKGSIVEDAITTLTKIYARSKIVLRLNTALKQGLSLVQIIGEGDPKFIENAMKNIANPFSFKWALDNLPLFRDRWESRTGGDDRLSLKGETTEGAAKKIMDIINKTSNIGMIPNAAVDLYVCGVMAKAMYETKYNFYKKERGYSTEESIAKALKDAEIVYNESQQSAEDMWLSRIQKNRTFMAASISLFNNASFAYQRLFFEGVTSVLKQIKPKGRERLKATQKAKYIAEGRTPEVAEQYAKNDVNRALSKGIMQIGLNGYLVQFVWNVGSSIGIMKALQYISVLFGDDDRDKEIAIENFKEDMRNSVIKSLTTPVRGLPGGKELESLTELYLKGWNIRQMNVESNPLITDTKQTFNDLSEGYKNNDWVKIVNAFVRYSSGFTGVDLNTIANVTYGIYNLIENHENLTTSDVLLDLSLIINSPKSEQKFLAVSRRDNDTFEDIVNRYIELKRVHKYGSFSPFTDKEDSKAKQDVAKIINVRYHTLKDMLNEYDKAIETYNKFHTDDYIDLYINPSYKNASDLKYELEYTAKNDMLNETQLGALKTAIESLEKDESLNEIYKKAKKDAWSTSRQKEPELE